MTSLLKRRWRSRKLVGDSKHVLIVRMRKGHIQRGYLTEQRRIDNNSPIFPPLIWKGRNHDCWKARWHPDNAWRELPNVQSAKWSRQFDPQTGGQNGAATATVIMDNISFTNVTGPAGLYHAIDRGHFSPQRGEITRLRPRLWRDKANSWQEVANAGWQIEIWEGYGSGDDVVLKDALDENNSYAPDSGALARTFTGIVTDCEQQSHPDQITLTASDFTVLLTDERIAGWNKALEIPSPVTFADRKRVQGEIKLSGPYRASSNVVKDDGDWTSQPHDSETDTTGWVEIVLQQGYYEEFFVSVPDKETVAVSLWLGDGGGTMDRVHPLPEGWVDLTGPGTGTVNGYPYMRKLTMADSPARRWYLGHGFNVPNNSKLRLTFLKRYKDGGQWYAGTDKFSAYKFGTDPSLPPPKGSKTKADGFILVEDASEVIRMILIWAGFQEWHVESFGWSLFNQVIYASDKFYMDVITDALKVASFIFYMGQPTNDDRSIGVPHFEHMAVTDRPTRDMLTVRDTDMTEDLTVKWDLSTLPEVLRYRGALVPKGKKGGGTLLGFGIEGRQRRYQATYYPPWSQAFPNTRGRFQVKVGGKLVGGIFFAAEGTTRDAGILRQFTESMGDSPSTQLYSDAECLLACVLAAVQYALNMGTAQFQIPGVSPVNLNDQVGVVDEAAAINSRLWVASIDSEHVTGGGQSPGHWRMTIGGALIDTKDMDTLRYDYNYAWKRGQRNKAALATGFRS